jgi:hypothetical protein
MKHVLWLSANPPEFKETELKPFAIAMNKEYKISEDAIECYRHYYRTSKEERGLIHYTKREKPTFL